MSDKDITNRVIAGAFLCLVVMCVLGAWQLAAVCALFGMLAIGFNGGWFE